MKTSTPSSSLSSTRSSTSCLSSSSESPSDAGCVDGVPNAADASLIKGQTGQATASEEHLASVYPCTLLAAAGPPRRKCTGGQSQGWERVVEIPNLTQVGKGGCATPTTSVGMSWLYNHESDRVFNLCVSSWLKTPVQPHAYRSVRLSCNASKPRFFLCN